MTESRLFWNFTNLENDEADVDIFDVIGGDGWWEEGIKASDFVRQMRALNVSRINLHINSPGGYVSDGLAMYNAIRQHAAHVVANVESQAASIASVIAMAADEVLIAKNAEIMIHDAQGFAWGNAADFKAMLNLLEENSENIASIYAEKTGGETADWRAAMQANAGAGTTYRGPKAVDAGLADGMIVSPKPRNLRQLQTLAITNLRKEAKNAGRTMSQRNLDSLHGAMTSLSSVHDATCDMDDGDCPIEQPVMTTDRAHSHFRNDMGQCCVPGCDDMASGQVAVCSDHLDMLMDLPPEGDDGDESAEIVSAPEPLIMRELRKALNLAPPLARSKREYDALSDEDKIDLHYWLDTVADKSPLEIRNATWSSEYIDNLPDSAFAAIEAGGEKDDEGKTKPRSLRHYPHHDDGGAVDKPHVDAALARIADPANYQGGKAHLEAHAKALGEGEEGSKDFASSFTRVLQEA